MLLRITHDTHYRYSPDVETAQHMAYLRPRDHASQQLQSFALDITPGPSLCRAQTDVFGNTRHFFAIDMAHPELHVVARSVVRTQTPAAPESRCTWEQAQTAFTYRGAQATDPAAEFTFASPFVPLQSAFADYAAPSFVPGARALDAALDLVQRMHHDFTYESRSTEISTPAQQALAQRKGVCQDFAHIAVACLRSMGLPARYVSGYLLTQPLPGQPRLVGADASHAWASVYLPDLPEGQRWVDLDPTNNRWGWGSPGADYVTVALGRDFGDVSPLRGVIQGGSRHVLSVGVTVEPVAED
ncbi:MAG: transglutaminase family protein [Rhodoferax sp.]|nr:MAG: transglutaminase family protein [Rhodoferax sp.]